MKQYILKAAAICVIAVTAAAAPAKAITFRRDPLSLISFRTTPNTKVIIRDSAGRIIRSKDAYGSTCNMESSSLQPGVYSYTITNGTTSTAGEFSVK